MTFIQRRLFVDATPRCIDVMCLLEIGYYFEYSRIMIENANNNE